MLTRIELPLSFVLDQASSTKFNTNMFKILTLIVLGYFAYKLFLGPDTTIKIERNPNARKKVDSKKSEDDYTDYEEVD